MTSDLQYLRRAGDVQVIIGMGKKTKQKRVLTVTSTSTSRGSHHGTGSCAVDGEGGIKAGVEEKHEGRPLDAGGYHLVHRRSASTDRKRAWSTECAS